MKYFIIVSVFMLAGCEHVIMFEQTCRKSQEPQVPQVVKRRNIDDDNRVNRQKKVYRLPDSYDTK